MIFLLICADISIDRAVTSPSPPLYVCNQIKSMLVPAFQMGSNRNTGAPSTAVSKGNRPIKRILHKKLFWLKVSLWPILNTEYFRSIQDKNLPNPPLSVQSHGWKYWTITAAIDRVVGQLEPGLECRSRRQSS